VRTREEDDGGMWMESVVAVWWERGDEG